MIYFTKHTEAAPQAKVKKRKTFKQVIQEKEEKAKEQALKRVEEAKSMKEVRNWYIVATVYLSIFSQSQVSDIYCGSARIFEDFWGRFIDSQRCFNYFSVLVPGCVS